MVGLSKKGRDGMPHGAPQPAQLRAGSRDVELGSGREIPVLFVPTTRPKGGKNKVATSTAADVGDSAKSLAFGKSGSSRLFGVAKSRSIVRMNKVSNFKQLAGGAASEGKVVHGQSRKGVSLRRIALAWWASYRNAVPCQAPQSNNFQDFYPKCKKPRKT